MKKADLEQLRTIFDDEKYIDINNPLEAPFRYRVYTEKTERKLYSHDVGTLPPMVKWSFKSLADVVVIPETVEEVQALYKFANERNMAITPRGMGTSGYGGVLPIKKGIVACFSGMNKILELNEEEKTVTVEAGLVWSRLQEELNYKGFMLKTYPTSALGSTVGGWVAEGGGGIGSFETGYFNNVITSIEIVVPTGEVKTINGDEMNLLYKSQGTLGIITKVTIKIDKYEEVTPIVVLYSNIEETVKSIKELVEKKAPIWHISFNNKNFTRLKSLVAEKDVPEDPPVTVTYAIKESQKEEAEKILKKVIEKEQGIILPKEEADYEWSERFYPMRMKRLGPSLIPAEAIVSLENLESTILEIERKIKGIAIETIMANKDEAILLAFLLADEQAFSYNMSYGRSLKFLKIVEKYGGKAYSIGLYFIGRKESVYGERHLKNMATYKGIYDKKGILNPGKVLESKTRKLHTLMSIAETTLPLHGIGNFLLKPFRYRTRKRYPDAITAEAFACAQCGMCVDRCEQFAGMKFESSSPRGKFFLIREAAKGKEKLTQEMVDQLLLCTTCKRCDAVCQVNIPIQGLWDELRGYLVQEKGYATFPAFEMMGGSTIEEGNIWAHSSSKRTAFVPEDVKSHILDEGKLGYWAGCTASYVEPNIAVNSMKILKEADQEFVYLKEDEWCCGVPMFMAGKWDIFEDVMRHNIEQINKRGIEKMIVSCPGCWVTLTHYYKDWSEKLGLDYKLEVEHITEAADRLIKEEKIKMVKDVKRSLTWHDPCHIGRHGGIYDAPRDAIGAISGVDFREMKSNKEDGLCCGSVLTRIRVPSVSNRIAHDRIDEAREAGVNEIVTVCPCCEFQLRVGADALGSEVKVTEFTELILEGMGIEPHPDPTPQVLDIWKGVFLPAIQIMTPEGLLEMMDDLALSMIDKMPSFMLGMMRGMWIVKNPMIKMMGSMPYVLPKMFDMMLPGILEKMIPEITEWMAVKMTGIDKFPQMLDNFPAILPYTMEQLLPVMMPKMYDMGLKSLMANKMITYFKLRSKGELDAILAHSRELANGIDIAAGD